jgi:hypothetical protein
MALVCQFNFIYGSVECVVRLVGDRGSLGGTGSVMKLGREGKPLMLRPMRDSSKLPCLFPGQRSSGEDYLSCIYLQKAGLELEVKLGDERCPVTIELT